MEIKTETIMVEQESILYVAKDGKEFTTQKECEWENMNSKKRKSEKIRLSYVEPVFRMRMSFISLQMKCSKSLISWIWILPHSGISSLKYLKNIAMPVLLKAVMSSKKKEKD